MGNWIQYYVEVIILGLTLAKDFYDRDTLTVARELLGKNLVNETSGFRVSGRIVEVEAYMGPLDKAAHSYNFRRTERVEAMYGEAGTVYVFFIYGMHYCFNVVTNGINMPEAVLIRALEPLEGLDTMSHNRFGKSLEELSKRERINLTNGPSKLCSALGISKSYNMKSLVNSELHIEDGLKEAISIKTSKRIGIDYAEEAKDYPWRFFIDGNKYVSK